MIYTIEVTDNPDALVSRAIPDRWGGAESWHTIHDGELVSDHAAKKAALELTQHFRFVRVTRAGRPWYIPPQIPTKQQELIP